MKIAFIARSSLFEVRGGDTTQVLQTSQWLNKLGAGTEIFRARDNIPYGKFDILHFFNIIRPADILFHTRKSSLPYVVSTIYLDYSAFDRRGRGPVVSRMMKILGKSGSEYIKNLLRYVQNQDKLVSPEYLLGHKRAQKIVFSNAAMLLPNSHSEYNRLSADLGMEAPYMAIPNGVDHQLFATIPPGVDREDKVISVGQVYGRKNQLPLIEICNELNVDLEIIGKSPPNHKKYFDACKRKAGKKVIFQDRLPIHKLVNHYASAKVHALPSWAETTGLTSLEAGAMGCNLVVGLGGDTKEYFSGIAEFCDAGDYNTIKRAVENALNKPSDFAARKKILSEYTWEKAAIATFNAYKKVLEND